MSVSQTLRSTHTSWEITTEGGSYSLGGVRIVTQKLRGDVRVQIREKNLFGNFLLENLTEILILKSGNSICIKQNDNMFAGLSVLRKFP